MDPEPRRDYVHVDDVIEAYIKASEQERSGLSIYNVGLGKSYSVTEVVEKLLAGNDAKVEVVYSGERRKGEVMDVVADISRAKGELGWEPRIGLDEGLAMTARAGLEN